MKKLFIVITCLFITTFLMGCSKSLDKEILGKWTYEIHDEISDKDLPAPMKMAISCNDEFFPNKAVKHDCKVQFTMAGKTDAGVPLNLEFSGKMEAAGDWTVTDNTVYDKTIDAKMDLDELKINGQVVTDEKMIAGLKDEMKGIFIKGDTEKMKTVSIDKNKWAFELEIEKKIVTVTANRQ